jgi:glutathione peroxidase
MTTIYDFIVEDASGKSNSLSDYKGKVILIVNVASKCGFTPQYEGLQTLYTQWHEKGFEILGFPCNQFANQENGTNEEIQQFCKMNYGVTFPVFAKINVNGKDAHPLYKYLRSKTGTRIGSVIKWNFTKFLIDQQGEVIRRFEPNITPDKISPSIEKLLSQ